MEPNGRHGRQELPSVPANLRGRLGISAETIIFTIRAPTAPDHGQAVEFGVRWQNPINQYATKRPSHDLFDDAVDCFAVAISAGSSFTDKPIRNYATWTDTAGNPISCHDGGITRVGDTFYWYGTSYKGNPKGL